MPTINPNQSHSMVRSSIERLTNMFLKNGHKAAHRYWIGLFKLSTCKNVQENAVERLISDFQEKAGWP